MATARNEHTGDAIATRVITDTYRDNYDKIFGKKKKNDDAITSDDPVRPTEPTDSEQNS